MIQQEFGGTWIEAEELAYPAGSLRQSRRKGKVLFPDGVARKVTLGIPDTYFSIPARGYWRGKTVHGFVSVQKERFVFTPMGKNKFVTLLDTKGDK